MYDTLMQMGRWFGYRKGYEDVCRIYLPAESIEWYEHIAEKTEELRQQIRIMRRDKLTPKQFGLYVERHPDRLMITAANKMRNAVTTTVLQSYSGRLVESDRLPSNPVVNAKNEKLIQDYWEKGFGGQIFATDKGWWAKNVDTGVVESFLSLFEVHSSLKEQKRGVIDYLGMISDTHATSDVLLISVAKNDADCAAFRLGFQIRNAKQNGDAWETSKARVASRGDERLGLTDKQKTMAQLLAEEDHANDPDKNNKPSDVHYRRARNKPLLMLHILEFPDENFKRVPAFGISFPFGDYTRTVRIAANKIWVSNSMQEAMATIEDEEDFDE